MSDDTNTSTREVSEAEASFNKGAHLFRLYIIDADSDPLEPQIQLIWKRGDQYADVQSHVRAWLRGEGKEGDIAYSDEACTEPFELGPPDETNWHLAQTRKHKTGSRPSGIDKEWVRILLARDDLTAEQKMAEIAKYT